MLKIGEIKLYKAWRLLAGRASGRSRRRPSTTAPSNASSQFRGRYVGPRLRYLGRSVANRWNELVASGPASGLRSVRLEGKGRALKRIPWQSFPRSLRDDVERYVHWASMPDPLAEGARTRALSRRTLRLQQEHIHSP